LKRSAGCVDDRSRLSIGSCIIASAWLASLPVMAQDAARATATDTEDEETVVVTAQRQRGAVIGDIKPELQLGPADIRSLGVTSISDLLAELGPELR